MTSSWCCVRSSYRGQGREITSHGYGGVQSFKQKIVYEWQWKKRLINNFTNNMFSSAMMLFLLSPTLRKQIKHLNISGNCTEKLTHERSFMMTSSNGNIFCVTGPLWPVTGGFPSQRPVTWSFGVFFDLCLNKRLSKQSRYRLLRQHGAHCDYNE